MKYQRLSVKGQQYNSGEWRRLQELEDLIEKANEKVYKDIKKDRLIWVLEMSTGSQECEIEALKKEVKLYKSKIAELVSTSNENVVRLENKIKQLEKEKGRLIEAYREKCGSDSEEDEEKEPWWQK